MRTAIVAATLIATAVPGIAIARPDATPKSAFGAASTATSKNVIVGTSDDNDIAGTRFADKIFARSGDDHVDGEAGDDVILGQPGDDMLNGDDGSDIISGGVGDDRLRGGAGDDALYGKWGDDLLVGGGGRDLLSGAAGDDNIGSLDGRADRVSCGEGDDVVMADLADLVAADCEIVEREEPRAAAHAAASAAATTRDSQLDYDRLGPIRIGMTLAEARRASGQPLAYADSIAARPGCGYANVQPRSLGVSLGVLRGVVVTIQLRRSPIGVRGGARIGDSLGALKRRYGVILRRDHPNPYVRTLTSGSHRIVFSVYEGHDVDVITAGRRPAIDWSALCV